MLDTFFNTMGTNHFDSNDYIFEKPMINGHVTDASSGWADHVPPTFHDSTNSLAQTAMLSHDLSNAGYGAKAGLMQISQDVQPKMTTAEVLAAASTLVRNGQYTQPNGQFGGSIFSASGVGDRIHESAHIGSSSGAQRFVSYSSMLPALTEQSPPGFPPTKATSAVAGEETLLRDMYFGSPSQIRNPVSHTSKPPEIQWGSDVSFLDHGYVAPPSQETEEEVTKTLMHKMECFQPQGSANTTRPPSPVISRRQGQPKGTTSDHDRDANSDVSNGEGAGKAPKPRKRRKKQYKHGGNGAGNTDHSKDRLKRDAVVHNGKGGRQRRSTASDSSSKRRKSQSGEPKPNRENLTEEQKRSNHILSEQKRRNLIKLGFEDLCKLVPELKGGGFSKSAMLLQAADWLEDMISGNEVLKAQLAGLERRRTA